MGRFDLTRTQERWTISVLAATVASIGAFIVLRRPSPDEADPHGQRAPSFASQLEPGTYALTRVSWMDADQTVPSGRHQQPPDPDPEDGREVVDPSADGGLPPALRELEGMPISVGGR